MSGTTPADVWHETYDAELVDGGWQGSCKCPSCGYVANHYNGPADCRPKDTPEFECIECGHQSDE